MTELQQRRKGEQLQHHPYEYEFVSLLQCFWSIPNKHVQRQEKELSNYEVKHIHHQVLQFMQFKLYHDAFSLISIPLHHFHFAYVPYKNQYSNSIYQFNAHSSTPLARVSASFCHFLFLR